MEYFAFLKKKDGTDLLLKADSLNKLRLKRSEECRKLIGQLDSVGPIMKNGHQYPFYATWLVKPKKGVKD